MKYQPAVAKAMKLPPFVSPLAMNIQVWPGLLHAIAWGFETDVYQIVNMWLDIAYVVLCTRAGREWYPQQLGKEGWFNSWAVPSLWKILGVAPDCNDGEVRSAFHVRKARWQMCNKAMWFGLHGTDYFALSSYTTRNRSVKVSNEFAGYGTDIPKLSREYALALLKLWEEEGDAWQDSGRDWDTEAHFEILDRIGLVKRGQYVSLKVNLDKPLPIPFCAVSYTHLRAHET